MIKRNARRIVVIMGLKRISGNYFFDKSSRSGWTVVGFSFRMKSSFSYTRKLSRHWHLKESQKNEICKKVSVLAFIPRFVMLLVANA